MDVHIAIEDDFMNELMHRIGTTRPSDVIKEALTMFNWAIRERSNSRVILSANEDGTDTARLAMPVLDIVSR